MNFRWVLVFCDDSPIGFVNNALILKRILLQCH
jgi:hypothetical protein